MHDGVLIDPNTKPPEVYIETKGLIVDTHRVWIVTRDGTKSWDREGTNIPSSSSDIGTPDIYMIPDFNKQDGNILKVFVDLYNKLSTKQKFKLKVEIHQADYEPDILFNEDSELEGKSFNTFHVFVPLRVM